MCQPPVVVIVEDDQEMSRLEQELLALHGLESMCAYDGIEAIDLCQRCNVKAVMLDLMLPKMDGFETCKRLRECLPPRLPIIIVTALDSDDCRQQGFQVGADAYFSKPFDPDEVIHTLERLMVEAG